jgi:hypothetical protein
MNWTVVDGLILYNGRVYISPSSPSKPALLELANATGHEGVHKTLHRLRADFHTSHDHVLVQDFVRVCAVCQHNKSDHLQPGGLLQPLEVPSTVWADVPMDFVEALPRVNGKSVILTVVDRFSKSAHFIALSHPYTAPSVARVFSAEIVRLHGIPSSIVNDRDPVFTSSFWRELFRLAGVKLHFTSAFHPQSDGQSEATNKIISMYLRCLTGDRPHNCWNGFLGWSSVTIHPTSSPSRRLHLKCFIVALLHQSDPTFRVMLNCQLWTRPCGTGTFRVIQKCASAWSRLNSIARPFTIASTGP